MVLIVNSVNSVSGINVNSARYFSGSLMYHYSLVDLQK